MLSGAQKPWLLFLLTSVLACSVPDGSPDTATAHGAEPTAARTDSTTPQPTAEQVSQYIRCIFQDSDGDLWFGTTTDGVVRHDGSSLTYFNATNGFGSDWVNAMVQDAQGDLWFATRDGVVRFNGNGFTRYTTKNGLPSDRVWCLLLDRSGMLWAGTYEGLARFAGRTFSPFPIPAADLSSHPYYEDPKKINALVQDRNDLIWIATNGGGVYRYAGNSIVHLSEEQGLCSDFVQTMLVDREGLLWFGTRFGGLCTYRPSKFTSVDSTTQEQNVLYQQSDGTLWTVNMYVGLCKRGGGSKTCYTEHDGTGIRVPMCLLEDNQGRLWIGTGAGLYRYEAERFVNVTKADLM